MSRAGTPAQPADLVDVSALLAAYADRVPDLDDPAQRVVFGTSGHRGSSLDGAFTDTHIAAITQAIVEYRAAQGTTGPVFVGAEVHGRAEDLMPLVRVRWLRATQVGRQWRVVATKAIAAGTHVDRGERVDGFEGWRGIA